MALLHHAQLVPSKLEVVGGWIAAQSFWPAGADPSSLERVASFRFDDPAGQVGVETLIVRVDGTTLQIPLTYRGAPLDGAESALIGRTEHSVLGTRWVYEAPSDPVYLAELVRVAVTGDSEVEQYYEQDGTRVMHPGDAQVRGSGRPDAAVPVVPEHAAALAHEDAAGGTLVHAGATDVLVVRVVGRTGAVAGPSAVAGGAFTLHGTWSGAADELLAVVTPA